MYTYNILEILNFYLKYFFNFDCLDIIQEKNLFEMLLFKGSFIPLMCENIFIKRYGLLLFIF